MVCRSFPSLWIRSPLHIRRSIQQQEIDMRYLFEKAIDLTHELHNGMMIYPGDPSPSFVSYATLEKNGVNLTKLTLGSHTGTHIDDNRHFSPAANGVDKH